MESWIEALHVISVIMWMAGMLYLPRLYVYHAYIEDYSSESYSMLKLMELRLLRYIINPAMISTLFFGVILAVLEEVYHNTWFHIKVLLVAIMIIIHIMLSKHRKAFVLCRNTRSALYFRILNEIVTVLIICIVIMVIVKPFS